MENLTKICNIYASKKKKLTQTDITEKRNELLRLTQASIEKDGLTLTLDNIPTVFTTKRFSDIFNLIDAFFFDTILKKTMDANKCCFSICLDNKCTKSSGTCWSWDKTFTIKLSTKVFKKSFEKLSIKQRAVGLVDCDDLLTCILLVLEHEIVHAIVGCNCKAYGYSASSPGIYKEGADFKSGHSITFMSILNNRFGQTSRFHQLFGRKIATSLHDKPSFSKKNLNVGDRVKIKLKISGADTYIVEANIIKLNPTKFHFETNDKPFLKAFPTRSGLNKVRLSTNYNYLIEKMEEPVYKTDPPKTKKLVKKKLNNKPVTKKPVTDGCTTRNPRPPCKSGYTKKKRPNGTECCYKGTTKKLVKKPARHPTRVDDFRYLDPLFDFISKPHDVKDLSRSSKTVNYQTLQPNTKKYIDKLKRFHWNKDTPLTERDSLKDMPQHLILKVNSNYLLVDTQGHSYVGYANIIKNLPNPDKGIKDVFKEECTTRNPSPPCKEGYKEKKRPNGALCCYKN